MASNPTKARPAATSTRGPIRSASGPNNGESTPPQSEPKVIAAAVSVRLQPKIFADRLQHHGHRDVAHAGCEHARQS